MVGCINSFRHIRTQWTKGWRGSVKARHFILALKDYYAEKAAGGEGGGVAGSDQWALRFIGVNYVRNILEAFDEDASGFVTVKEANDFTRSRPLDWRWVLGKQHLTQAIHMNYSLPHWLAYWAIGDYRLLATCGGFRTDGDQVGK